MHPLQVPAELQYEHREDVVLQHRVSQLPLEHVLSPWQLVPGDFFAMQLPPERYQADEHEVHDPEELQTVQPPEMPDLQQRPSQLEVWHWLLLLHDEPDPFLA